MLPSEEAVLLLYGPEPIHEARSTREGNHRDRRKAKPVTAYGKKARALAGGRGSSTDTGGDICRSKG